MKNKIIYDYDRFFTILIYAINKIFLVLIVGYGTLLAYWYFLLAYEEVRFGNYQSGYSLPAVIQQDWDAIRNLGLYIFIPAFLIINSITVYVKIKKGRPLWGVASTIGWLAGMVFLFGGEMIGGMFVRFLP